MRHANTTLSNKTSSSLPGVPHGWSVIRRRQPLTEARNNNPKMANVDDESDTASEMDDDELDTASDDDEDASLKQVAWEGIKGCIYALNHSSNNKDRLEQMTKASIALFLHIASEESVYEGAAMWRTICEDDHLHSMFRGITAYRHLLHLGTAQFQTSNKGETEVENVRRGCLVRARCHWWAGLSAFSEKHWNAMQQKVFRELNIENWRNIEKNIATLKPQEQARIEAALRAYDHARVIKFIRKTAQRECKYCPLYVEQRAQRKRGARELLSPTYLTYVIKHDPTNLEHRIDSFLKQGDCLCCRNQHT